MVKPMSGSAKLLLVLVAGIIIGILVGGAVEPIVSPGSEAWMGTSRSTSSHVSVSTTTRTLTRTETVTVTETKVHTSVSAIPVTVAHEKTVTVTSTVTSTATETARETTTITVTETLATTRTVTLTVTEPLHPAVLSGILAWSESVIGEEEWWMPRLVRVEELLLSEHGLEVYRARSGLVVFVNKRPDPSYGHVFLVEDIHGRKLLVLWPFESNKAGRAIPAAPSVLSVVSPELVVGVWPLDVLASLGQGEYRLVSYQEGGTFVACPFTITTTSSIVFGGDCIAGRVVSEPEQVVMGSYRGILDALVHGLNTSSVAEVGRRIFGGQTPRDTVAALWDLLAWAEYSLVYDDEKYDALRRGLGVGVQAPLETLQRRRGICSDYAVLLAAAIEYLGFPAMVIGFPNAGHAAAAVVVNNTVLVLDQRTPVIELQDYLEYIVSSEERLRVYLVYSVGDHGSAVIVYGLEAGKARDSYPADRLEPSVAEEAIVEVAARLGLEPNPALGTVAEWFSSTYKLGMPMLQEVSPQPAPLDALYSPLFYRQWTGMLVEYIEALLDKYYPESIGRGSFWVVVDRTNTSLLVKAVAVPVRYNVSIRVSGTELAVTVASPSIDDPVRDVAILVYRPRDSKACAGIAPPGYYYENIPYVNAEAWRGSAGEARIVIDLKKIRGLASACPRDSRIGIWIRDSLVYLAQIPQS